MRASSGLQVHKTTSTKCGRARLMETHAGRRPSRLGTRVARGEGVERNRSRCTLVLALQPAGHGAARSSTRLGVSSVEAIDRHGPRE
eukprot:5952102-Prymnesium_polylepis.2